MRDIVMRARQRLEKAGAVVSLVNGSARAAA